MLLVQQFVPACEVEEARLAKASPHEMGVLAAALSCLLQTLSNCCYDLQQCTCEKVDKPGCKSAGTLMCLNKISCSVV